MIKAETKDNGKVRTLIRGESYSVLQEFFSIVDQVTKLCMHSCETGDREELAETLKEEIDKTFAKAIWGD